MDYIDEIYYTLCGELVPEAAVPGVENVFAPGSPCDLLREEASLARYRILHRLGVGDEDPDMEIIINAAMDIQEYLCRKMFLYGVEYGRKSQ